MTDTSPLFPDEPMTPANPTSQGGAKASPPKAAARVLMPNRHQLEWRASDLDSHLLRLAPVKRQGGLKVQRLIAASSDAFRAELLGLV